MIPLEQKNLLNKKKKDKREGIPIMLVQALEYQYTACQRGTTGRSTKSVAPRGCGFVWSVGDGGIFYHLQPSGTQIHLPCKPHNICLSFQQQSVLVFSRTDS